MVVPDRDELIKRLAEALVVSDARRSGDPQTRVRLDHYLPSVGAPGSAVRWRLYTARHRLIGVPGPEPARSEWHRAEAAKGRRLIAVDVRNSNRGRPSFPGISRTPTSNRRERRPGAAARI